MSAIAQTLARARRFHQAGELIKAESLYGQILQADPDHGEALFLLGVACQQQNRLGEALAHLRRAMPLRPNDPNLIYHLGLTCQAAGSHEEAAAHFRQCLRLRPDLAAAHFSLGNTHLHLNQLDEAILNYRQAIRLQPAGGPAYLNLANALERQGRLPEAAECLRDCLFRQPQYADAQYNLGNVLVALGRLEEAVVHYQQALRLQPSFALAHNNLGSTFLRLEKVDEAAEHFQQAVQLQPNYAEAHFGLGLALRERQQVAAAVEAHQQVLRIQPDNAVTHNNLGEAYLELGDMQQAQVHFREAHRINPALVQPLLHLAANDLYSSAEPGIEQIKARLMDPNLSRDCASMLHFILGNLLDRAGATDDAFDHFSRGNALRRLLLQESGAAYDARAHAQRIDRLSAFFSAEFFERTRGFGLLTEVPVFIVGMPRSGSTLVEQILSQHSQVHGAGELKDVSRLVAELPAKLAAMDPFPECLARLKAATAQELGEAHLRQLTRRGGSAARITDKMLDNFLYLGLLAVLFPRARVIHCTRDPRDVCLSCFFQFFKGLSFTWDLDDLGRHYRGYERLMAHWRAVLPLQMLDVAYEDLVTDLESVSRRLIAFCGLPWEDRCLRYQENQRLVQTMSRVQVRQPIYTSSVGRWERYASHLAPLVHALEGDTYEITPATCRWDTPRAQSEPWHG
jgi:tetratricopeptide (TPR) repeat protein